jgi:hypothetical protein
LLDAHLVQRVVDRGLVGISDQGRERGRLLPCELAVRCRGGAWVLLVADEPEPAGWSVCSGVAIVYHLS